jgi:hypothetical protein
MGIRVLHLYSGVLLFRCWLIYGVAQVSEYITLLLTRARSISNAAYFQAMASPKNQNQAHTRFLSSQNPALIKRNLLASFTDVLLLLVTIVPRTVGAIGAALTTGGSAAARSGC